MVSFSAELKKLKITRCDVDQSGNITESSSDVFTVMLNPESFKHEFSASYNKKKTLGQIGSELKFSAINPDKVSFTLIMDGTGVVKIAKSSTTSSQVKEQLQQLQDIIYKYDGNNHEPNHVKIVWGSLLFYGRLTNMSVDYNLFKPSGEPLRAKVSLSFAGFLSSQEMALRANNSSPDLTHYIEVKEGDTLPLLCQRIYKEGAYYLAVARINNIDHFRNLKPGQRLYFPPLG